MMEEYVGKSIFVFDENGNGMYSIDWPWTVENLELLDSQGARYAITDKALPDKYWMDEAGDIYIRESAELSIDKSRILSDGLEEVIVTGLPEQCTVLINGQPHEVTDGQLAVATSVAGSIAVCLAGVDKSNIVSFDAIDIADYRASVKTNIDTAAEECRNRVITPGSGQAMTYLRKAEAAKEFLAGDMPDGPQKDRITDEATRLGVTLEQAAEAIVAIADGWEAMDRTVDKVRLDAKKEIDAATTLDDIDAVCAAITWPA